MAMERTISGMVGKGSISHNERKFIAENVDRARSIRNIVLVSDNIKDVYHELFDGALERYNAKQKRNDRKITDYYDHIRTGKQEKLFHEVIFQIGNKDDCGCFSQEGQIARLALLDFAKEFQERNPQFRVFGAYLHMDEATPHLHIDFVPYMTGSKRGLDTRVSMKQALASRGFIGKGKSDTEYNQWIESEKKELASVAERYGIVWKHENTHREHLSVLDFKKEMRTQEVNELEDLKKCLQHDVVRLEDMKEEQIQQVEKYRKSRKEYEAEQQRIEKEIIDLKRQKKTAEVSTENAKAKAVKQEQCLQKAIDISNNIRDYAGEFYKKEEELVPEPELLESAKHYRSKKVLPLIGKMKEKIQGVYLAYIEIKQKLEDVQYRYNRLRETNDYLTEEKNRLLSENRQLFAEVGDFRYLKKRLGDYFVDKTILEEKQKENRQKIKNRKDLMEKKTMKKDNNYDTR